MKRLTVTFVIIGVLIVSPFLVIKLFGLKVPIPKDEAEFAWRYECQRTEPYPREPIIEAAMALISDVERSYQDSDDKIWAAASTQINNCLNINFVGDGVLNEAEGGFAFDEGVTTNDLKISISERYRYENANVIAALLQHEIVHAVWYLASSVHEKNPDTFSNFPAFRCTEEEAIAFLRQYIFLVLQPVESQQQMYDRFIASQLINEDPEVEGMLGIKLFIENNNLIRNPDVLHEIERGFVVPNPAYIEQCNL